MIMAILWVISLAFGEDISWSINGKVWYGGDDHYYEYKTETISPGNTKTLNYDLSPYISNYQAHITINCYDNGSECVITANIVIDDAINQQNLNAFSEFWGWVNIDNDPNNHKDYDVTNDLNHVHFPNGNYKNQTLTWTLPKKVHTLWALLLL